METKNGQIEDNEKWFLTEKSNNNINNSNNKNKDNVAADELPSC